MPESHLPCSTLVSTPASSTHSCEGSRQLSLGAQGACSWQRSRHGTAPGNEIPLSTPCAPGEGRGLPALPALTLAVPSGLFPSPSQSLLLSPVQLVGGHGACLPLAPWKEKIPLLRFCRVEAEVWGLWLGSMTWEAQTEVRHRLLTLSALPVSKYLYSLFLRGGGICVSNVPES